jgi:hypothetical protein
MNGIGLWCHQTLQYMAIERPKSMVAMGKSAKGILGDFAA